MSLTKVTSSCGTDIVGDPVSIEGKTCFIKGENLKPYIEALGELRSGTVLIAKLNSLRDCGLSLVVEEKALNGDPFESRIAISEISDGKVEITLPPYDPSCKISIPILCKRGDSFCVQEVQVPAFIAVGHELIHFIHKAEALNSGQAINDINNWNNHRANRRAIATLYGYDPAKYGISDDENSDDEIDPLDKGLSKFEDESVTFPDGFLNAWGNEKAYEELRTITGKETNSLSPETSGVFTFESSDLDLSERYLLCDFFTKHTLPSSLKIDDGMPFITRWTHALNAEAVQKGSFDLVRHLFTEGEISRLPIYVP